MTLLPEIFTYQVMEKSIPDMKVGKKTNIATQTVEPLWYKNYGKF